VVLHQVVCGPAYFLLHELHFVLHTMLVGEDAEGPFEKETTLTRYHEETLVLIHQVEDE
jgi:hypothetical protein